MAVSPLTVTTMVVIRWKFDLLMNPGSALPRFCLQHGLDPGRPGGAAEAARPYAIARKQRGIAGVVARIQVLAICNQHLADRFLVLELLHASLQRAVDPVPGIADGNASGQQGRQQQQARREVAMCCTPLLSWIPGDANDASQRLGCPARNDRVAAPMGNRLSRIVTRTGDAGTTGLGDGSRVAKDSARIEAIGAVDELNSAVGWLAALPGLPEDIGRLLLTIQHDLFDLGGELAVPGHSALTSQHVEATGTGGGESQRHTAPIEGIHPARRQRGRCALPSGAQHRAPRRTALLDAGGLRGQRAAWPRCT